MKIWASYSTMKVRELTMKMSSRMRVKKIASLNHLSRKSVHSEIYNVGASKTTTKKNPKTEEEEE